MKKQMLTVVATFVAVPPFLLPSFFRPLRPLRPCMSQKSNEFDQIPHRGIRHGFPVFFPNDWVQAPPALLRVSPLYDASRFRRRQRHRAMPIPLRRGRNFFCLQKKFHSGNSRYFTLLQGNISHSTCGIFHCYRKDFTL